MTRTNIAYCNICEAEIGYLERDEALYFFKDRGMDAAGSPETWSYTGDLCITCMRLAIRWLLNTDQDKEGDFVNRQDLRDKFAKWMTATTV